MLLSTIISLFFGIWSLVFLIDYYLRSFDVKYYVDFAHRIGLTVSFLQLRFYTNRFHNGLLNQQVRGFGPIRPHVASRLVSLWFMTGAAIALVSFCGMTLYLSNLLLNELLTWYSFVHLEPVSIVFKPKIATQLDTEPTIHQSTESRAALTLVVPGLNVPWWHLPLFILALVIAGIMHELGHALAAVDANVPVSGFGIFIFAIYPGAFTEIDSDALSRSSSVQKMRIFGAGIWHNLVLALFGYLLFSSAPMLLSPLYSRNAGVLVRGVSKKSGLSGEAGLHKGDVLSAVDDCRVHNIGDWLTCMDYLRIAPVTGYCLSPVDVLPYVATEVEALGSGELHCCGDYSSDKSLSHICFHFRNSGLSLHDEQLLARMAYSNASRIAELLGLEEAPVNVRKQGAKRGGRGAAKMATAKMTTQSGGSSDQPSMHACLAARFVTGHETCDASSDCDRSSVRKSGRLCVYPALFNGTSLLRLFIVGSSKPVLFIGSVDELVNDVEISELVPRFFFVPSWLPFVGELFSKYLVTFSSAMALLNAVPCYGLDGQLMVTTVIESLFSKWTPSRRRNLNTLLLYYGTFVLSFNVIIGIFRSFVPFFKESYF
uniref:Membrane-bound transcription factor site-2 protease n=1 Tax=Ascaris suum TaxID=6253 RepID=F1KR60_ASCSU